MALITMKNGKLGWTGPFPDGKELSDLLKVLTDDYIKHGGTITRK